MSNKDEFVPLELDELTRCDWAIRNSIEMEYHDNEWGRPQFDSKKLFEALVLESMSAGISWVTVLYNRDDLREAFDNFDPDILADYDQEKVEELIGGRRRNIVRDRLKIHALVTNAKGYRTIEKKYGSFSDYIWKFVDGKTVQNQWELVEEIPHVTPLAEEISESLEGYGFRLVGAPTVYNFMQAVGLVNDHLTDCYLYDSYK